MKEVKAIIQPFMLDPVLEALSGIAGLPGLTVSQVQGWGEVRESGSTNRAPLGGHKFANMVKLEIVVPTELALSIADVIAKAARTGNLGDGRVFTIDVAAAVKIRTGEPDES